MMVYQVQGYPHCVFKFLFDDIVHRLGLPRSPTNWSSHIPQMRKLLHQEFNRDARKMNSIARLFPKVERVVLDGIELQRIPGFAASRYLVYEKQENAGQKQKEQQTIRKRVKDIFSYSYVFHYRGVLVQEQARPYSGSQARILELKQFLWGHGIDFSDYRRDNTGLIDSLPKQSQLVVIDHHVGIRSIAKKKAKTLTGTPLAEPAARTLDTFI